MTSALIPADKLTAILDIDKTVQTSRHEVAEAEDAPMLKAFIMARTMQRLREQLTPGLMQDLMALAGTTVGFKTDREYPPETIRDVLITAMLRGFRPVGNEIVIIGGNPYYTKGAMERVLREYPGFADLKLTIGVPMLTKDRHGALVPITGRWTLHGKPDEIRCAQTQDADTRIPVRVNEKMGADAIIGKAKSKILRLIYERITGSAISINDDDHEPQPDVIDSTCTPHETEPEEPAIVDTGPETPPDQTDEALDCVIVRLMGCTMIREADTVLTSALADANLTDTQHEAVKIAHKETCDRIRATRGPRTNGAAETVNRKPG